MSELHPPRMSAGVADRIATSPLAENDGFLRARFANPFIPDTLHHRRKSHDLRNATVVRTAVTMTSDRAAPYRGYRFNGAKRFKPSKPVADSVRRPSRVTHGLHGTQAGRKNVRLLPGSTGRRHDTSGTIRSGACVDQSARIESMSELGFCR